MRELCRQRSRYVKRLHRTFMLCLVACGWQGTNVVTAVRILDKDADDAEKQEAVKKELKKFEGTWGVGSVERNGGPLPKDDLMDVRLPIKDDKFNIQRRDITTEGTFKVDPAKKPKVLDATSTEDGKKVNILGIYEFDGDTLKVCYTTEGGERPKEFSRKVGRTSTRSCSVSTSERRSS